MEEPLIRGKGIFFLLFVALLLGNLLLSGQTAPAGKRAAREAAAAAEAGQLPPRVALTFDDGPHPLYTKLLLEGLRKRGVKATFFVVGENIPGQEELIGQMSTDGHLIGNHTYDHADISKMSGADACTELEKTDALVKEITGSGTAYVRAPFGNWKDEYDRLVSMISVKWTLDPMDWAVKDTSKIVEAVVSQAEDGEIILLHDIYSTSVEAALQIADILTGRGFVFVTVEELLLE